MMKMLNRTTAKLHNLTVEADVKVKDRSSLRFQTKGAYQGFSAKLL